MAHAPLKLRRVTAGMTQHELASAANISQQKLSKLETGAARMKASDAMTLANLLGCRPAELLPELALTQQPDTDSEQELDLLQQFRQLSPTNRSHIMTLVASMVDSQSDTDTSRATAN